MRFESGRVILHRHFQGDRLGLLKTATVVSDDDQGLLLWVQRGTPMLDRRTVDGRGLRALPFAEWIETDTMLWEMAWNGRSVLKWLPRDADHSVWFFWNDQDQFARWYVNLEEEGVRWDDGHIAGIDIVDQDLDIVAAPDRTWRWKDEDEFVERLAYPEHYWVHDEASVRAEGERVAKLIEAAAFPFDGTWVGFTEDPSWTVPDRVPDGWARPRARARSDQSGKGQSDQSGSGQADRSGSGQYDQGRNG